MTNLIAKRTKQGVPIWNLYEVGGSPLGKDINIGILTALKSDDRVKAFLKTRINLTYKFEGASVEDVLTDCRKAYVSDADYQEAEYRDLAVADAGWSDFNAPYEGV